MGSFLLSSVSILLENSESTIRLTPAAMAACIQILSVASLGDGRAEITTSIFLKAEVRSDSDEKSTLTDLVVVGAGFLESLRPTAVTVKPAVLRAVKMLDPTVPVACSLC